MNEPRHRISPRILLVIISVITLILLAGSAILERVVFHAATANSSVYLAGPTSVVAPQSPVQYTVMANLDSDAVVAGGQFVVSYNPSLLSLVSVTPAAPWRTNRLLNQTSDSSQLILWSIVPSDDQGTTVQLTGPVNFGTLRFTALKAGVATTAFNQPQTIIVGVNGSGNQTIYNAVNSVQSSNVVIGQSTLATQPSPLSPSSTTPTTVGSLQRILNDTVSAGFNQAVLLASLKYNGLVTVRFGTSRALSGQVQSTVSRNQVPLLMSGLAADTEYFYQVSVLDPTEHSSVTGSVKSFQTTNQSSNQPDPSRSTFHVFPDLAANTTELYMLLRDSGGNMTDVPPVVSVDSGSAIVSTTELSPGFWVATIKNGLPSQQTVTLVTTVNGSQFDNESVVFNPSYHGTNAPAPAAATAFHLTPSLDLIMAALGLILLLAIVAFVGLSRVQ